MTTIAFIGLGIMGAPMAANLVSAGHDVTGFNRSRAAVDTFISQGGSGAQSVEEAIAGAEIVVTMLPDSPDVESVLSGENGVFARVPQGTLVIDFSTIRPDVAIRLAEEAATAGVQMLDAPVSGGEAGAIEAVLSVMVGGSAEAFAQASAVFDAVGSTIVHVGPSGSGQTVKAANQLIVAGTMELVAEALVFLEAHGVDMEPAVKVLSGGLAGSTVLSRKAPNMLSRNFAPGFRVTLHDKDLGIVTAAAREAGVAIPLGAVVAQLMGSLKARGDGDLDHSALFTLVSELSGRSDDRTEG